MLAVVRGIEHFRLYITGIKFLLLTDHRPLVGILSNARSSPSARIEQLALRIQQYSFTVQHTDGRNNPSDYLSRHPLPINHTSCELHAVPEVYIRFEQQHSIPRAMSLKEVVQATKEDAQLQLFITALKEPEHANWSHQDPQAFARPSSESGKDQTAHPREAVVSRHHYDRPPCLSQEKSQLQSLQVQIASGRKYPWMFVDLFRMETMPWSW